MLKFAKLLVLAALPLSLTVQAENELQQEIKAALAAGKKKIVLTQKEYRISKPVVFSGKKGITLDGNGALITVTGDHTKRAKTAFFINNKTTDCTFKNFSIDYDPVPFTQGVVTAVEGQKISFVLDKGYPDLLPGRNGGCHTHVFTPDGKYWKPGQSDVYGWITFDAKTRTGFVSVEPRIDVKKVAKGDRLAIDWRGRCNASVFNMGGSGDVRMENINILASPGCSFSGYSCVGRATFDHVTIKRGPQRPGMERPRLLSTVADGVHFGYGRRGVKMVHCDFSFMGDDSVNHHGGCHVIGKIADKHTFHLVRPGNTESGLVHSLIPGDKLRVLAPKSYQVCGLFTFESIRELPDAKLPKEEAKKLLFRANANWCKGVHRIYAITVKEEINFPAGSIFDVPSQATSDYEITNCYFHDHRAYGLRVMSCNGRIENCRFERLKGAAVNVSAQYHFWGECGWAENITIRNNVINECGNGYYDGDSITCGAICFTAQLADYAAAPQEHRNVTITGNKISNTPVAGIFLLGVRDGVVKGNTLQNVQTMHGLAGKAKFGDACSKPVSLWHCGSGLKISDNIVK